jgi:hypothetical protein
LIGKFESKASEEPWSARDAIRNVISGLAQLFGEVIDCVGDQCFLSKDPL